MLAFTWSEIPLAQAVKRSDIREGFGTVKRKVGEAVEDLGEQIKK